MARPSRNTDQRLIAAARRLLLKTGATGLNLRAVAKAAGVNLGMFHYHFGSKEAFIRRVLMDSYQDFFRSLQQECTRCSQEQPIEALRTAALCISRFARDNRALLLALAHDVMNGNRAAADFVRRNLTAHVGLLLQLAQEGMRAGVIRHMPLPTAMSFLVGSIVAPSIMSDIAMRGAGSPSQKAALSAFFEDVLSDDAIVLRVELAISALTAHSAPKGHREREMVR